MSMGFPVAKACREMCRMRAAALKQSGDDWMQCGDSCVYLWAEEKLYTPNPLITAVESIQRQRRRRRRWRR